MKTESWIKGMGVLEATYGKVSTDKQDLYFELLQEIPGEVFEAGVKKLVLNYEYPTFPTPAIIAKYCGMDQDSKAHNAMLVLKDAVRSVGVYQSVDLGDRALHAVVDRFGGWKEVCSWPDSDWSYREKMMMQAYKSAEAVGYGPIYLVGIHEESNRMHGHDKWVKPPMVLDSKNGSIRFITGDPKKYLSAPKLDRANRRDRFTVENFSETVGELVQSIKINE
jgi:hypothetical protein